MLKEIAKTLVTNCRKDNVFSLSAALAYYIMFAIAPIVYVIAWFSSFILDDALQTIIGDVLSRLSKYLGDSSITQIRVIIEKIFFEPGNVVFNIVMLSFVLFFSTSIFSAIRKSLNIIWKLDVDKYNVSKFLKNRLAAFLVLACMAFLIVSITVISAFLGGLENYLTELFPNLAGTVEIFTSTGIEFLAAIILFVTMFKVLPDVKIHNRDIFIGSIFTSILFVLGKFLIGLYLSSSFYGSIYDAIGSVMIIILWFYYIALIFYLGAEFTYAVALHNGRVETNEKGIS